MAIKVISHLGLLVLGLLINRRRTSFGFALHAMLTRGRPSSFPDWFLRTTRSASSVGRMRVSFGTTRGPAHGVLFRGLHPTIIIIIIIIIGGATMFGLGKITSTYGSPPFRVRWRMPSSCLFFRNRRRKSFFLGEPFFLIMRGRPQRSF